MAELLNGFNIFRRFGAIVETINSVNIDQIAFMIIHQGMAANWSTEAVTDKSDSIDIVLIQNFVYCLRKEIDGVIDMRFAACAIAGQVEEQQTKVVIVTQTFKLFLPSVEIASEAVNETNGLIAIAVSFIMNANTVIHGDIFRFQVI